MNDYHDLPKLRKFGGFLEYKWQWSLTLRVWFLVILVCSIIFAIIITQIQGFLAIKSPIKAEVLLIEGWVGNPVIQGGVEEFNQGNYNCIIITGTPIYRGFFLTEYQDYTQLTAATLVKLGIDLAKIITIVTPEVQKDRTAAMALAVKDWLSRSQLPIKAINLYSFDVHTRRSYLIYRRVLKSVVKVGAIAHPNTSYNPKKWWTSSVGFPSVIGEAIAYFYARFLWHL